MLSQPALLICWRYWEIGSYLQIGGPLPRCSAGRRAEAWKRAGKRFSELTGARELQEMNAGSRAEDTYGPARVSFSKPVILKGSELDLYLHLVLDLRSFSKEHFFCLNCLWRHFKLSGRRNSFHTAEDFLPCSLTFSLTTATLYSTNARTHTHAKQQLTSAGQPSRMARVFGKLESKGCEVWTRRVPWRQTQSDSLAGETLYISTKTQGEPDSPGWGGEFARRLFIAASNYKPLLIGWGGSSSEHRGEKLSHRDL